MKIAVCDSCKIVNQLFCLIIFKNHAKMICESQLREVCRNIKQKYNAFLRNGFVLAAFGSTLINNLYLDKVSNCLLLLSVVLRAIDRSGKVYSGRPVLSSLKTTPTAKW